MTVFFSYDEKRAPTFQPDCPMAAPCGANPWRPCEGQTSFTILPSCTTTCYQRSGKGQKKVDKRRSLRLVSHTKAVISRAERHSARKGARGYARQANPRCHKGQDSWRDPQVENFPFGAKAGQELPLDPSRTRIRRADICVGGWPKQGQSAEVGRTDATVGGATESRNSSRWQVWVGRAFTPLGNTLSRVRGMTPIES